MSLDKRLEERRQAVELRAMKSTSRGIMATFVVAILAMVAYRAFFPGDAYTLYRVADDDPKTRTLVATFDSEEGAETNKGNCENVLAAMQQQKPAYKLRYTCDRALVVSMTSTRRSNTAFCNSQDMPATLARRHPSPS